MDALYRRSDGVLVAEEIKASPGALLDKLAKAPGWLQSYSKWLEKGEARAVSVQVMGEGPKFGGMLDPATWEPISEALPGSTRVRVGPLEYTDERAALAGRADEALTRRALELGQEPKSFRSQNCAPVSSARAELALHGEVL